MATTRFVLLIDKDAPAHVVVRIAEKLTELDGRGIESNVRTLDALLEDVRKGIPENLLLKTDLKPYDLQDLLTQKLGPDFQSCRVQWL